MTLASVCFLTGRRVATTDQAKHALSMDRTFTTILFILISRGSSMRHLTCNGLYLFTFIIKFRIRDSVHPQSCFWNSSSDVRTRSRATRIIFANQTNKRIHSFLCSHFYSHVYHPIQIHH